MSLFKARNYGTCFVLQKIEEMVQQRNRRNLSDRCQGASVFLKKKYDAEDADKKKEEFIATGETRVLGGSSRDPLNQWPQTLPKNVARKQHQYKVSS